MEQSRQHQPARQMVRMSNFYFHDISYIGPRLTLFDEEAALLIAGLCAKENNSRPWQFRLIKKSLFLSRCRFLISFDITQFQSLLPQFSIPFPSAPPPTSTPVYPISLPFLLKTLSLTLPNFSRT